MSIKNAHRMLHLKRGQVNHTRSSGRFLGFRKHLNNHHVIRSFKSGEDDFSAHQSVDTSKVANVDESTEHLENNSELSSPNLVHRWANVISDSKAAGLG